MKICEVNTLEGLLDLRSEWTELLKKSDHSIFSTWEWLCTWWKHFGNNKHLLILLAYENERLVGIAPLMYSIHTKYGLRQGMIEFTGTWHSNYADFIIKDNSDNCLPPFIKYLHSIPEKWNCAALTNVPGNQRSIARLKQITNDVHPSYSCLHTLLPNSIDALLGEIKRKDKKELKRV